MTQTGNKQRKNSKIHENAEKRDLLSLKNDVIFKMVFGDVRNKKILRALLAAMLDLPEEEYEEIEIADPHLRIDSPHEKLNILDVHIRTKKGKLIDVEIQVSRTPFMKERVTGYTGKMLSVQLSTGEDYTEMKKVISVVILDYDLIEDSESFHNKYLLYDAKTKSLFTDILEIHTFELKKLPQTAEALPEEDEKAKRRHLWMSLIKAQGEEEVKMLATKSPEIGEAYEVLKKLSGDEEVRFLYESREKAIRDEQARLYGARKEGIKEGKLEGIKEGIKKGKLAGIKAGIKKGERNKALETARKLLEMGLSAAQVAQGTTLTIEEVQSLRNEIDASPVEV
jgi:predicted transposase/invertase (TIGR01784 family)